MKNFSKKFILCLMLLLISVSTAGCDSLQKIINAPDLSDGIIWATPADKVCISRQLKQEITVHNEGWEDKAKQAAH